MTRYISLLVLTGSLALPFAGGCDREVAKEETVKTRSDGTTVKDSSSVKEKSDGTVVKQEEHKVSNP